jgi:O-antigen ligase
MFQYAGFQSSREKTIISTNFGDRGNSHSEYIGPLAESGILGTLSFVLLLVVTFYTGFRYYNRNRDRSDAWIALAASLGMLTYAVHGFLNNFLDTDKASALFWGYMAVIVTLDLYGNHKRSYIELDSKDRNIIKNS